MKKIALIFGGTSSEYEVSLKSATSVLSVLENLDIEIYKIGIASNGKWYLTFSDNETISNDLWLQEKKINEITPSFDGRGFYNQSEKAYFKPDILFPMLHGGTGENGTLQGVFECMQIPYVGCRAASSAICMNKYLLHQFAKSVGVMSTPTQLISSTDDQQVIKNFTELYGFPIFIKPNEAGSSKGISKVHTEAKLAQALTEAFQFSQTVILQKAVSGIEIGCAILGNNQLLIGECDEVSLATDFFDYTEKYQMTTAKLIVPAKIPVVTSREIKRQAQLLYQLLGCRGLARIDFFLTETGEILLNEINTMPGFTNHSRFPAMMAATGITYQELISTLITLAEER
ncbi:D-alanine--D-alanine ligase [Enterococcus mundtii 3F]|uniref:D-alanine--D-alanine ligase n=1 Tax=Enterococcus faecium TaxID=1352 RepID=A0A0D5MB72_ENTFC|nr:MULTISPECIES: D-alanine--D-serine ligase VanN [Enterococcus]AJY53584.1 VanN D-alanine-D-serine ligase [Enterococcus faecium]MDA9462050.1 D-alanine--D-alanine ligase [Enterococcus mundtii 3F]